MKKKGMSLIELLVTIAIFTVVMAAVYTTFINLLRGYKQESKIIESQVAELLNTEIIRVDLLNMGLGVADDEVKVDGTTPVYPATYDDTSIKTITINSTYDRNDPKTQGWLLLKCEGSAGSYTCDVAKTSDDNAYSDWSANYYSGIKVMDTNASYMGEFGDEVTYDNTYTFGDTMFYAMGYPYDSTKTEKFNSVVYTLGTTCGTITLPSNCHPSTKMLCRGNDVVAECISDIKFYFGYESGGNIVYTKALSGDEHRAVKRAVLYGVVQQGIKDKDYSFEGSAVTFDRDFEVAGSYAESINIPTTNNAGNYRWHLFSVDVKSVNIK